MSITFEGIEPDQYGRHIVPYMSKTLEKEVSLTIPTENGVIQDWQLILANEFCEREEDLKDLVYQAIFLHYQEEAEELKPQFGGGLSTFSSSY